MDIYVGGKKIRLQAANAVGKGGEADVYDLGNGNVAKVFKQPNHTDYAGFPMEQEAARRRILLHQEKLRKFPKNLPAHVLVPAEIATDSTGKTVLGYTMPFLKNTDVLMRYADKAFRAAGVPQATVVDVFRNMQKTVRGIHAAKVVIGDFNDLNVLISGTDAYFIDADSYQFSGFPCPMFSVKFVDPLLCGEKNGSMELRKLHTSDSDWYAFAVMYMQCLLFTHPYGGIYRPKAGKLRIPHDTRALARITVFHPDVQYPKPALRYEILPDDLLHYFHQVFERDLRGEFPEKFLMLRWVVCSTCKTEHARAICPTCATKASGSIRQTVIVRGKVTATRIFRTHGVILAAAIQQGKILWAYAEDGRVKRESGRTVLDGDIMPKFVWKIQGDETYVGNEDEIFVFRPNVEPECMNTGAYRGVPVFDVNALGRYWIEGGNVVREGRFGAEIIGSILAEQTFFWVGESFGFGFYRAGAVSVAFVFDAASGLLNDRVAFPKISGHILDAQCFFTGSRCWFFVSHERGGKIYNHCRVFRRDGSLEAEAEGEAGDGTWLSTIKGKCAIGSFLLAATDEGIVRVEFANGLIGVTKEFPDTEPFVDSETRLFADADGVYAVGSQEITILKIQ